MPLQIDLRPYQAATANFKLVNDVACQGRNELNDQMPTQNGVSAEVAKSACAAVPTCIMVESYGTSTQQWMFSSSCTETLATSYTGYTAYFRQAPSVRSSVLLKIQTCKYLKISLEFEDKFFKAYVLQTFHTFIDFRMFYDFVLLVESGLC